MRVILVKPLPERHQINQRFNEAVSVGTVFNTINNRARAEYIYQLIFNNNDDVISIIEEELSCFKELT